MPIRLLILWCFLGGIAWGQSVDTPTPQLEASPSPDDPFVFRGYWASSYSLNFEHPSNGMNNVNGTSLRGYDFDDRKLKLDILELDFQYGVDRPGWLGARLDVDGGGSMPKIDTAAGLFRDPYTGETNARFDIRQAFLTYKFEESNFRIDLGKFATYVGYEIMDGVDGTNPNATRSYTYTTSLFTNTGLRMSYPVTDWLTVTGVAVFGSDKFQNTPGGISLGTQLSFTPTEDLSIQVNYLSGPEQARNNVNRRQLTDFDINYKITESNTLGMEFLTATEAGAVTPGAVANWNGLVFYLQNQITDQFWLNFRQEWYNDPQGARLGGDGQRIRGFTITPEYRFTPDWLVRMDLRFDTANRAVFDSRGQAVGWMNTLFFNHILKF